jgi:hypothetical protein
MSRNPVTLEALEDRRLLSAAALVSAAGAPSASVGINAPEPTEGRIFNEVAGKQFTANVGEITLKVTDLQLNAVIHWGDGAKSAGTLNGSYATGEYYVQGTHTYAHAGAYKVHVEIFAKPVGSPITPTSPILKFNSIINALTPTAGGKVVTKDAKQTFTTRLGEIHFKTVDQLINAEINWGDGTRSAGKLVGSYATGDYYVEGTHAYDHAGTFKVTVQVFAHLPRSPFIPTTPIRQFTSVIVAKPLIPTAGGRVLSEQDGKSFTAKLGEFTFKTVDQLLDAQISWGDGKRTSGKLEGSYATGKYYVEGTHTYAAPGTYKVIVRIFGHLPGSTIHPTSPLREFTSIITVNE